MDIPTNAAALDLALSRPPMAVLNRHGRGPLLICEHASRYIPEAFHGLDLHERDLARHIAWDLGALDVARELSAMFDAPLVNATYSRLLLDLNRPTDAIDSIVLESEGTEVPGNAALDTAQREQRRRRIYEPFHAEVEALLDWRLAEGLATVVLSIHSFTPRYHGVERPWHVGVISRHDRRLAEPLLAALRADPGLCVGDNLPYGSQDGVYHSLERHGEARGLHGGMIEIRNDLIGDAASCKQWSRTLGSALEAALRVLG